jgi:uncharacterized integral membrane protein
VTEAPRTPESQPGPSRRDEGRNEARSWIIVVILALALAWLIAFVVENRHGVPVHWVFATSKSSLIWVIFVTLLLGVIVGELARRLGRSRRRRAQTRDR